VPAHAIPAQSHPATGQCQRLALWHSPGQGHPPWSSAALARRQANQPARLRPHRARSRLTARRADAGHCGPGRARVGSSARPRCLGWRRFTVATDCRSGVQLVWFGPDPGAIPDRHHKGCRRADRSKRCGRPGRSWLAGRFVRGAAIAPPAPGIGRAACRALTCLGAGPYGAQLMVQPREQGGAAEVSAVGHHGGHAASTGRPSRRHSSMPSARWRAARPLARSWRTASRASTQ